MSPIVISIAFFDEPHSGSDFRIVSELPFTIDGGASRERAECMNDRRGEVLM